MFKLSYHLHDLISHSFFIFTFKFAREVNVENYCSKKMILDHILFLFELLKNKKGKYIHVLEKLLRNF